MRRWPDSLILFLCYFFGILVAFPLSLMPAASRRRRYHAVQATLFHAFAILTLTVLMAGGMALYQEVDTLAGMILMVIAATWAGGLALVWLLTLWLAGSGREPYVPWLSPRLRRSFCLDQ